MENWLEQLKGFLGTLQAEMNEEEIKQAMQMSEECFELIGGLLETKKATVIQALYVPAMVQTLMVSLIAIGQQDEPNELEDEKIVVENALI